MRHVGYSVRCVTIESLKFLWMGTDNHQVWANLEVMTGAIFRRFPGTEIHVRDADAINVRRAAGKVVLHPAQEYGIGAPWLIVRGVEARTSSQPTTPKSCWAGCRIV